MKKISVDKNMKDSMACILGEHYFIITKNEADSCDVRSDGKETIMRLNT